VCIVLSVLNTICALLVVKHHSLARGDLVVTTGGRLVSRASSACLFKNDCANYKFNNAGGRTEHAYGKGPLLQGYQRRAKTLGSAHSQYSPENRDAYIIRRISKQSRLT
jgi:hypothetical protein